MKNNLIYITIIISMAFTTAQKDIVVSDDLAANGEKLKVKMGNQWMGKIWKFQFGEYSVGNSKNGWQKENFNSSLFGTKAGIKNTQKYSFTLESGTSSIANVNAASDIRIQIEQGIDIVPFFSTGETRLSLESVYFSAFINVDQDSTDTWMLLLSNVHGDEIQDQSRSILSNGARTIHLMPASSNKNGGDNRTIPALGYELVEGGKALAAVQYYGGGVLGTNKNVIWLSKHLNDRMRLVLAAAMTAVLQEKVNSQSVGF